jgi:Ser/Thr protein kinase RdoA (MazF antagonist)
MIETAVPVAPSPPFDPALPRLAVALDGEETAEILAEGTGDELLSCRPRYIRYKPGTNCVVLYDLALADGTTTLAHVKLYPGDRARRRAESDPRAALVEELGAVLYRFPVDPRLPALARLDDTRLVRYKPARRAVVELGDGRFAKLYADDRGPRIFTVSRSLADAGVQTPAPLAYDPSRRMLVFDRVDGRPLDKVDRPALEHRIADVAVALARIHAGTPSCQTAEGEASRVLAAARTLAQLRPERSREARRLGHVLASRIGSGVGVVHGDFSPDQVLVSHGGLSVLDFDGSRLADPLLDVGSFLAHLSLDGHADLRDVFLAAYADHLPLDRGRAVLFESVALLKLAVLPFRRLEPDWPSTLERRLALAERRLEEARERPALPQLRTLLRQDVVARELEIALGANVEVREIEIVREKPGRRCTLRYDLVVDGRARRVYGKTYASERAPRVWRTARSLAQARAFGPDVSLPAPLACVPRLKLVVQGEVQGTPVAPVLDARVAARLAEALHRLHRSGVKLEPTRTLEDELETLRRLVPRLPVELQERAGSSLTDVDRAARKPWRWRSRPVHRDFYPDQILVAGDRLGVLDLDDAAMAEPALDVANFVAHVRLQALKDQPGRDRLMEAARAFLVRYAERDPDLDRVLVRLLEGATLLRLACIHGELAGRLLDEAEEVLA